MSPVLLVDTLLSVAAVAGLLILRAALRARDPRDPINRRFLFAITVSLLIFGGRSLVMLTGADLFRVPVLLGGALVPLAVLVLTEGLLRRHAPGWIKTIVAMGASVMGISALWYGDGIDPPRLLLMLGLQVFGLAASGGLILWRDRSALSPAENRMVERLGLSLVLLVPLATSDFLVDMVGLPIMVSPLGVLFLCWLAIGLGRPDTGHMAPLAGFAALVVGAGVATWAVTRIGALDRDAAILAGAVILAAVLVPIIWIEARALLGDDRRMGLLRHLAGGAEDAEGFIRGLRGHPAVQGAAILTKAELADLDEDALSGLFTAHPVLRRAHLARLGGAQADHAEHLFSTYEATHILWLSAEPVRLLALSIPALSATETTELELRAVQRMAALLGPGHGGSPC